MDRAQIKDNKKRAQVRRLPDAELEIMKELWAANEPLTRAALERQLTRRRWSSTTLLALLARLEEKKYVTRQKQGRGYLYAAALTREEYLPVGKPFGTRADVRRQRKEPRRRDGRDQYPDRRRNRRTG